MKDGSRPAFSFGENWKDFSRTLTIDRLEQARQSLETLVGRENLRDKSFLDIGCGSGLFSIAALQLGARRVVGVDLDELSVETSRANAEKWHPDGNLEFLTISILDEKVMADLGRFDVVYAWGVLHHTGNMRRALSLAAKCVQKGGLFVIAIYNRHFTSGIWRRIKWTYNVLPAIGRRLMVWLFAPVILVAKFLVTGKNPFATRRGMDFVHNLIDWLGGYPYEYASIREMRGILEGQGMTILRILPAHIPTGCNEYVCRLD